MKFKNIQRPRFIGLLLVGALTAFTLTSCNMEGGNKDNDDTKVEKSEDTVAQDAEPEKNETQETATASNQLTGEQTLTGEVLDMSCYMTGDAMGKGHQSCAQNCLDKGLPAGIMAENGQVYLLVENHDLAEAYAKAIEHAAQNITVSGMVDNKNGIQSITVEEVTVDQADKDEASAEG